MFYEKIKKLITIVKIMIQIFLIVISHDDVMELSLPMAMVTTLTMLMFLTNYIGQNVTDHNNEVYTAA
jgi:hypothetical protein